MERRGEVEEEIGEEREKLREEKEREWEGSGVERCWEVHVEEEKESKEGLHVIQGHPQLRTHFVICSVTICDPHHMLLAAKQQEIWKLNKCSLI